MTRFILASSSPRRKQLLKLIGIRPDILHPIVDETRLAGEDLEQFLERVTVLKARSVYKQEYERAVVIAADTVVVLQGRLIGKPASREHAQAILRDLSGTMHEVWTGISLLNRGQTLYDLARTRVYFDSISKDEIEYYLNNEDYLDKAGAYAIQGKASIFVNKIDGCFFNVMGFPLNLFAKMVKQLPPDTRLF